MSLPFKPYRPRAIAVINALGRFCAAVGMGGKLNASSLIAAARRKTGLHDFGDESFLPALEKLSTSIQTEAQLHPFGRWVIRNRLTDILATRLRVQALISQHPEILDVPIADPLVIAGLQRTGTTMLHRLLAADPECRALLSWEAISPMPHPAQKAGQVDKRIGMARVAEKGLAYLAPEFFAIHPVEALAPEEDVLLMEYAFLSQVPEATLRVPSYSQWLDEQDITPAYEYLKVLLQVLHWQNPGVAQQRRWVLKTPAHLEHLDTLLKVFPQARIVQTHRDPARTTGSFSSMLAHGYGVFSDHVDAPAVAAHWLRKNANMVRRAQKVRMEQPQAFIDVSYYDLLKDPMNQVQRIYDFAGLELTPAARQAMQASREHNRQNRHGKHSYELEDFGLDLAQVDQHYADYRSHYNIPREG